MTKVLGPMFSFWATGRIGKALTYFVKREGFIVRAITKHKYFVTARLADIRSFFRHSIWTWQHLTVNIVNEWDTWASLWMKNASGFNAFTSYYMLDLTAGQMPSLFPPI